MKNFRANPVVILFFLCSCGADMKKDGDIIVHKIEDYRMHNAKLPNDLRAIGIDEKEDGPFYYMKKDSLNYVLWFGTSVGESTIYYSDSSRWESRFR
jgi:hypothetical protein